MPNLLSDLLSGMMGGQYTRYSSEKWYVPPPFLGLFMTLLVAVTGALTRV
jgi:hypothetical protein